MRNEKRKIAGRVVSALVGLASVTTACNLPGSQDPEARIAKLEAELQEARAEATAEASGATAPADGAEPVPSMTESFEGETNAFELGSGASVRDGALFLGPYEECANDLANFDQPVGCMVVCESCGRSLSDYHLKVAFTFEDGLSDREFGVILRLVDQNVDGLLDREDYLLALGFNVFENGWRVYLHEPDLLDPWREISSGQAGFLQAGRMNELEVTVTQGGRLMEIGLNQRSLDTLTGGDADPGQRVVTPWSDTGAVGLIGLGRGVQARFDNFVLEASP
ncbi:MAG TPA: hypothetical protein VIH26_06025 [Anaerolineales bacterium]